ncbi:hypothetical protein T440DRAFT_248193 [Plenodomus tracheiphilus IPT5]|uniref:Uncharacterized protein n=1 Tax=Plenodomus tracheiphilus IPT5 TaxID=1408161 RepID=A0A6A7AS32_9PLEO|nr:hypothetical protein T440DRAFT_248193 [Plenodomus tracheiphilus IPT5]
MPSAAAAAARPRLDETPPWNTTDCALWSIQVSVSVDTWPLPLQRPRPRPPPPTGEHLPSYPPGRTPPAT